MSDTDPRCVPAPVRIARPLIEAFVRSPHAAPEHRWHARSTLPVLALFVAMTAAHDEDGLSWGSLDPDSLYAASLEEDPDERGFLLDLLEVSAAFYGFLGETGELPLGTSGRLAARLAHLAGALSSMRAPGLAA